MEAMTCGIARNQKLVANEVRARGSEATSQ